MSDSSLQKKFYIKNLAPEGGFGYVVAAGFALAFAVTWSNTTFSLLFNDFLTSLCKESSAIAILITVAYQSIGNFTSLIASILFKKFSMRSVGLFGSIVFCIGSVLTIFANSVAHIFVSFAVLQGIGLGLITPVAYATFNRYFVDKRVLIMSTTKSFIGVSSMVYPMLVQFLMDAYGFRGALAILTAINFHTIFGMLAMHPIEWHYRKVKIEVEDPIFCVSITSSQLEDNELTEKKLDGDSKENQDAIRNGGKWQKLIEYFDLELLKDSTYLNLVIGISFAMCSDSSFLTLQPLYLLSKGYSKADTAYILSSENAADLISRIFMAMMSLCIRVKARYIYLTGCISITIFRFLFLKMTNFLGTMIVTVAMGFCHTWLIVSTALVFAEYLPQEKFAFGYGFYLFVQGNLGFVIGPTIGWIRDYTQSYELCFHSLTLTMCVCIIPWTIEIVWLELHRKRNRD